MSKGKRVLFDESENEEEEEEEDSTLPINEAYAKRYQEWRRGEEIQKYKDRYGDEDLNSSSSESSSDDDFDEADNPEFDREFLRAMGALYGKNNPELDGVKFFTGDYSKKKKKETKEEAMTVKDYERMMIMEGDGVLDDEEDKGQASHEDIKKQDKTSGFEDGMSSDEDDEAGDGLLTSGLFKVKESTKPAEKETKKQQQEEKEEESLENPLAYIKGECSTVKNEVDKSLLQEVKEAWNNPKNSRDDKWLIDFFLNKRYNEEDDESKLRPYNSVVIDEESISDDEKTLETMEDFETKYRFRFEEPDQEFIKKYPRIIPDSLRAKDERRKQKRLTLKERKQKEKEVKRQEIERLKALKYKEIEAKIEKIKEASGNQDIDLGEKMFEEDFDAADHDRAMSEMFGDDYYTAQDGDEKPVFQDDDGDLDVIENYDNWLEMDNRNSGTYGAERYNDQEEEPSWEENEDYSVDNERAEARKAFEEEMIEASSKKRNRKRRSKFALAVKKKKPTFDPNEKNFESYFDEYYQLDFEDIISGVPCRFKYRKVEPNSFGLSTEEILSAQDRELNKWASLKKMLRYERDGNQELRDKKMYQHRASQLHVKQKILPSLFVEDPVSHHCAEEEKKRLKNLKKKLRRQQKLEASAECSGTEAILEAEKPSNHVQENKNNPPPQSDNISPKEKKRKRSLGESAHNFVEEDTTPKSKKKKHAVELQAEVTKENVVEAETQNASTVSHTKVKKKKKKIANSRHNSDTGKVSENKKIATTSENSVLTGISDSRLAAYGENPKKIKNKVKYRKKEI